MATIYNYLKQNCQDTFKERPLTEVDSLVLSQVSYFNVNSYFPKLKNKEKSKSLSQIKRAIKEDENLDFYHMENAKSYQKISKAFFSRTNRRFKHTRVNYFVSKLKDDPAIQFSAMCFFLDDDSVYIAFRGSDGTMTGYKEDFNMSFKTTVPGQTASVKYLNKVMKLIPSNYKIYLGGHSKGGNFAKYAAIYTSRENQNRITGIFDHDGPGFMENIFETPAFLNIKDKLHRSLPEGSVVGLLLNNYPKYTIVSNPANNVLEQHFISFWEIDGTKFKTKPCLNKLADSQRVGVNQWLLKLEPETREKFVDALFSIFGDSELVSVQDMKTNTIPRIGKLLKSYSSISKENKKLIRHSFSVYLSTVIRCRIRRKK